MSDETIFSCVRCYNIKNIQALSHAREHAFRRDEDSQKRVDLSRTHLNLVHSNYGDDGRDVVDCFKQFKDRTGIREQKNASLALHMLCIVSPEWLSETGDPRDPDNPRVRELFEQSQKWAEQKFGAGSVIAKRYDVDEAGSGVVDVFVCPSAVVSQKNHPGRARHVISTRKALKKTQREYKQKRSFMALQDSFAEFCQGNMDERIQRGIPKEISQREHVHADIYRPIIEEANRIQRQAEQTLKDAERGAVAIKEQAMTDAIDDFSSRSVIAKTAIAVDFKRKRIRVEGKKEGERETTQRAKRSINSWKKQNLAQAKTISSLTNERDGLIILLEASAKKSEPTRALKQKLEAREIGIRSVFEHLEDNNINPLPYIKKFKSDYNWADALDDSLKLADELTREYEKRWKQQKTHVRDWNSLH